MKYALAGNANKVLAAEYRMALPAEKLLADHVAKTRLALTRGATQTPGRGSRVPSRVRTKLP